MIPAGKSGGKHENGGFWRVEVSNEGIDRLEFETRVDENVVFARGFAGFGPIFKSASDGGTDGNHAVARFLSFLDGLEGFGRDVKPFRMHVMLLDVVAANREEGAKSDVESKIFDLDTFFLEFLHQGFSHIETGSWSSGRAELLGPDGLVTLNIIFVGVAMEIWRKRDVAVVGDDVGKYRRF